MCLYSMFQFKMKMQERMKMRSVSFSDEAPSQAPMLPPRGHRLAGNALFSDSRFGFTGTKRFDLLKLHVTFSEKGIRITPQTHIQKFKILKISLWNQFHRAVFPLC